VISSLKPLESSFNDMFGKKAPPLPSNGKKALVQYLPWINLILGLLTLYTVYVLWHWAHYASSLLNYANSLSAAYGGPTVATNRMDAALWLGLLVLLVEALLFVAAFPGTRDRKKAGWDLLFYAALVNVAYGVVILFSNYGGLGSLVGTVIGSAIGLYFLFQIRGSYEK
jgi:hypothetical protein